MSATNKPVVRLRTKSKSTAAPKKITITKTDNKAEDADDDEEMTMTLTPTEPSALMQASKNDDDDDDMPVIISSSPVSEKPAPIAAPNTPEQKVVLRRSFVDKTTINLPKAIADDSDATTIITSDKPSQASNADNDTTANDADKPAGTLSKNTSFKVKKLTSKMPVMANLPSPELMQQQQPKKQPPTLEKKNSMPFSMSNLPTNQSVASPKPTTTAPTDSPAKDNTSNNNNKTDNNASNNNATSTNAVSSPAVQIAPTPNEIILLHDGSAPSIILPSQEQQLPTYMMTHVLYLQTTITVSSLPTDEVKDMYPSDEDEDFEYYLQAVRPKTSKIDGEDEALTHSSMSRLQGMINDKEESLKFVSYVKNPLYDHKVAATPQQQTLPTLSKDEVMRLNEVARRCRELGDVNFVNYMQIQQVDKQLQKEYQKKALSRRLSTISGIRRGSVMQNKGIGIKDLEEFRNSDASLDESTDSPQTHRTHQGKSTYDIKTCSKSWKSQMKNLQDKGILDRKASASNAIFPIAPYPFPSCASVSKAGYMPEWRYVLQTKRLLDAKKTNTLVM